MDSTNPAEPEGMTAGQLDGYHISVWAGMSTNRSGPLLGVNMVHACPDMPGGNDWSCSYPAYPAHTSAVSLAHLLGDAIHHHTTRHSGAPPAPVPLVSNRPPTGAESIEWAENAYTEAMAATNHAILAGVDGRPVTIELLTEAINALVEGRDAAHRLIEAYRARSRGSVTAPGDPAALHATHQQLLADLRTLLLAADNALQGPATVEAAATLQVIVGDDLRALVEHASSEGSSD